MNEKQFKNGMAQFKMQLTDEQDNFIQEFWDKSASHYCAMMCQPQCVDNKWVIKGSLIHGSNARLLVDVWSSIKHTVKCEDMLMNAEID